MTGPHGDTNLLEHLQQQARRPEPECNGVCIHASELIECAPNVVAHAHPDCDLHGAKAVAA